MEDDAQLRALLDLAESIGIRVRRAPPPGQVEGVGDHPGGALVRLRDQEMLFVDPAAPLADRVDMVAAALRGRKELEDVFLPPALRELLEGD